MHRQYSLHDDISNKRKKILMIIDMHVIEDVDCITLKQYHFIRRQKAS